MFSGALTSFELELVVVVNAPVLESDGPTARRWTQSPTSAPTCTDSLWRDTIVPLPQWLHLKLTSSMKRWTKALHPRFDVCSNVKNTVSDSGSLVSPTPQGDLSAHANELCG